MKQYIITDPSYLLTKADYREFADLVEAYGYGEEADRFLTDNLFTPVKCEDTGFMDWVNIISYVSYVHPCKEASTREKVALFRIHRLHHVIQDKFSADTGMVCFLELTDHIKEVIKIKELQKHCYAVIECENPICEFDTSNPNWTVITITDGDRMFKTLTC